MTRNEIINEIANDIKYINYCKRVCNGNDLYNDLYQYILEELLKKEEEFLIDIYKRNNIGVYFASIAYKSYNSKKSIFYKTHKKDINKDILEKDEQYFNEEKYRKLNGIIKKYETINSNTNYEVNIFKNYLLLGTYRAVSEKTGIPFQSVFKTVKEFKQKIKQLYTENKY